MILPIARYNEPVLRKKGTPVREFDDDLKRLFDDMVETMYNAEGIGLAAQQIGRDTQFCVIDLRGPDMAFRWELDGRRDLPLDLIMPLGIANPDVTILPAERIVYEEGCLSFPEIRGEVERPSRVSLRYQDLSGKPHTLECDGLLARCVLHEIDHLHGVLFIDRMDKKTLKRIDPKLKELKRRTRKSQPSR